MRTLLVVIFMLGAGAGINPSRAQVGIPHQSRHARMGDGDASTNYYSIATTHALAGRYAEAIEAFKEVIRRNPQEANARYSLGNVYAELGRWNEAVEEYQEAVSLNPRDSQGFNNLGVAYLRIGAHEQAVKAFEQSIRIYRRWAEPHCNLGKTYSLLGQPEAAAASFKRAAGLSSGTAGCASVTGDQVRTSIISASAPVVTNTSAASAGVKTSPLARPSEQPIRVKSNEAKTLYDLGFKNGRRGNYADAVEAFKGAINLNPEYGDAYFGLGQAYSYLGRWSEAAEAFEKVVRIDPKDREAYEMLGKVYARLREHAKANEGYAVGGTVSKKSGDAALAESTPVAPPDVSSRPAIKALTSNGMTTGPTRAAPQPLPRATETPHPVNAVVKDAAAPKAAALAVAPSVVNPTSIYRVGVGDVLDVRLVDDTSGQSTLFTVTTVGLLEYPLVARPLEVSGLTTDEVAARLASELKANAIGEKPKVVVGVREYSSHTIIVSGLVAEPGTKVIRREAIPLYVVIADARPSPEAGQVAIISHANGERTVVDISDQAAMRTLIYPGDVLTVEKVPQQFFYIGGQVGSPGQKDFQPGITLTQAILKSGGDLSNGGVIKIMRQGPEGRLRTSTYNLKEIVSGQASDPPLQPNDRITIAR